jgi:hypothetical protein
MAIATFNTAVQANYSNSGKALATQARTSYEKSNKWSDADSFVGTGLQSIRQSDNTTVAEKSLATMGYNMGVQQGMQYENSARARYAVAGVIAGSVAGPIGAVMAQATLNAYGPATKWSDADHIVEVGLKSIGANSDATQNDRELAALGVAMGAQAGMQYENSARARNVVAQAIAKQSDAPIGNQLADASVHAYEVAKRWNDADFISGAGLKAILNNPRASEVQHELAQSALAQTTIAGITYQDSAKARAATLLQIAHS